MPAERPWWPGQDQEDGDLVDRLFAPRGLTNPPTDEHWEQALTELPAPEFVQPALPGLRVGDKPAGVDMAAYMKLVKQRAWELANGGQLVNTAESIGPVRDAS